LQCTLESSSTLAAPYLPPQAFPKEFIVGLKFTPAVGENLFSDGISAY
jgi:hypothetical protein